MLLEPFIGTFDLVKEVRVDFPEEVTEWSLGNYVIERELQVGRP